MATTPAPVIPYTGLHADKVECRVVKNTDRFRQVAVRFDGEDIGDIVETKEPGAAVVATLHGSLQFERHAATAEQGLSMMMAEYLAIPRAA